MARLKGKKYQLINWRLKGEFRKYTRFFDIEANYVSPKGTRLIQLWIYTLNGNVTLFTLHSLTQVRRILRTVG